MKKLNQKGFSTVEVILVIIVLGLLGAVGWLVFDKQNNKDTNPQQPNQQGQDTTPSDKKAATVDAYADWNTASFELAQASFKYPKNLKMMHELNADAGPNTGVETYTLTAADGTAITLTAFHFLGGFSGDEPKYLLDDVISSTTKINGREFSSVIYKNENGVYDRINIMDTTNGNYKTGEEKQIFINSFLVKQKGANKERTQLSIAIAGQKYQTYKTLAEIKSVSANKDIEKFLNALDIPAAD